MPVFLALFIYLFSVFFFSPSGLIHGLVSVICLFTYIELLVVTIIPKDSTSDTCLFVCFCFFFFGAKVTAGLSNTMSEMRNFNCEEGQNNERQTVLSLAKEIDYKNHQLLELEHKYNDTNALFRKVVIGLTEAINAKDRACLEMEQKYRESSKTQRELVREKEMLFKQYSSGIAVCFYEG